MASSTDPLRRLLLLFALLAFAPGCAGGAGAAEPGEDVRLDVLSDGGAGAVDAVGDFDASPGQDVAAETAVPFVPVATVSVDRATVLHSNAPLVNGAGLEVESGAQGLSVELFEDPGFEWSAEGLAERGLYPWLLWTDEGVVAEGVPTTERAWRGAQSFHTRVDEGVPDGGALLAYGAVALQAGRSYDFSAMFRHEGAAPASLFFVALAMDGDDVAVAVEPVALPVPDEAGVWTRLSLSFTPTLSAEACLVAVGIRGVSESWFDGMSLLPSDVGGRVWPELRSVFAEAGFPVLRLGGIAAEAHDWRAGVGPIDERPQRVSAFAGMTDIDPDDVLSLRPGRADVGTDEFLDFCDEVGAEALITACFPCGFQAAANWVAYTNLTSPGLAYGEAQGWTASTWAGDEAAPDGYFPWLREFFGHPEPWGVRYWEVGNEQWAQELPIPGGLTGPDNLEQYADGALAFAEAMKAVDPSIEVGAVAAPLPLPIWTDYRGQWNARVLDVAGDAIDFLAPHFYLAGDFDPDEAGPEQSFRRLAGLGRHLALALAPVHEAIAEWAAEADGRQMKLALTEYNVWFGIFSSYDEHGSARLDSTLGGASLRNVIQREGLWMANFYNLSNSTLAMVGWQRAEQASGVPLRKAPFLVQQLYAAHFAPHVHPVSYDGPTYAVTDWAWPQLEDEPLLDVLAASDDDGRLVLFVVNRAWDRPEGVATHIAGVGGDSATAYVVSGLAPDDRNTLAARDAITMTTEPVVVGPDAIDYTFHSYSVTALVVH